MKKGFTLLELLIVIAILAILATVVVLVLNPAEYLRTTRDAQRLSDLSTVRDALGLYLATTSTVSIGSSTNCYVVTIAGMTANCQGRHAGKTMTQSASQAVNGTGWVPVNFAGLQGGSPLSVLPVDPVNNTTYFYSYLGDSTNAVFELNANLESAKYSNGGAEDKESTDGGDNANIYEVGTKLSSW